MRWIESGGRLKGTDSTVVGSWSGLEVRSWRVGGSWMVELRIDVDSSCFERIDG